MALSPKETKLARLIKFDLEVCSFLKNRARKPLDRATGIAKDLTHVPIDGMSFRVKDGDEAERIMNKIQPGLVLQGYRAFWSVRMASNGMRKGDEVIVLKTADHFSIVKIKKTDGANYGISNKTILARLRGWEKQCTFEIVGASLDWIAIVFHSLPKNLCRFAEEVYRLCPDAVDQGVGLMQESKDPRAFAAARRLCPHLSGKMQRTLDKETKQAEKRIATGNPKLRALMEAFKKMPPPWEQPSTEMGIKLLAYELKKTKHLFLWWD